MNRNIKVGVVQMNSHVGAIDYNLKKIIKFIKLGRNRKVDPSNLKNINSNKQQYDKQ